MIDFGPTKLAFLGERNYLHSTDIFPVFLESLSSLSLRPGPDRVMSFKFHRETDRNGRVRLVEAGDNMQQSRGPAADITFGRDDEQQWKFEFYDDGPKIERSRPAPPEKFSNISLQADFAGTVACSGIENEAEFFATLVEANKALHIATLARRG